MLYTTSTAVPSAVVTELKRLKPAKIIVVAGSGHIRSAVYTTLGGIAGVEKMTVGSRFTGSRLVLSRLPGKVDAVYLTGASLRSYPLAIAAAAATGRAALLVDGSRSAASDSTVRALKATGATRIVILGSTASVGSSFYRSLAGAGFDVVRKSSETLYGLSAAAAKQHPAGAARMIMVNPSSLADAALGGALAGATRQPMAYTVYACVQSQVQAQTAAMNAKPLPVGATYWLTAAVAANTSCTVQRPKLNASLTAAINATIANRGGKYAVTVREVSDTGQSTSIRGSSRLEPASMMKLYAAWAALRRVQTGTASLSTKLASGYTLGTCLRVMIHASDNYCHADIVHWFGIGNLNHALKRWGFSNSTYGSVPKGASVLYAGNRTTTNDLSRFVKMLRNGELGLDGKRKSYLLDLMGSQIWTSRIPSGIPAGVKQQSKPGALWISTGLLQADTAIVYGKRSTYVLSIIGYDDASKADLAAISRTVYTHFNGSFGKAKVYPAKQMVAAKSVTMRTGPGGSSAGTLKAGTAIEITDAQRIWYKFYFGSRLLWVDSRALRNR
ncbi:hypothetical protein Microterr_21160 [Microbacterium terricola]|uniref:Beta-lactamase class A catalytic domain-containing protein n=2 Tax=Microbacterium terricola TaxID=344163 RepID=A0ABM8E0Z4_9MICO|nr:hypothetical protein Microterr_21160 [Microbacterium terricola]